MTRMMKGLGFVIFLVLVFSFASGIASQPDSAEYNIEEIEWAFISYPFAVDKQGYLHAIGDIPGFLRVDGRAHPLMALTEIANVTPQEDAQSAGDTAGTKWKYVKFPFIIDTYDTLYAIGRIPDLLQEDGSIKDSGSPGAPLKIAENVRCASLGVDWENAYYIDNDDVLYGWGERVGDGTTMLRETPILIAEDVSTLPNCSTRLYSIRKKDGTIWSWTFRDSALMPSYFGDSNLHPEAVLAPVQVDCDYEYHTTVHYDFPELEHTKYMLLDGAGTLYMYSTPSYNYLGEQVGRNQENITDPNIVVEPFMTNVAKVITRGGTTYVLQKDGALIGWGNNDRCQLGDGTNLERKEPGHIMNDVADFVAWDSTAFAMKTDGSLWAWGNNYFNNVGDGTDRKCIDTPVRVMENVVSISEKFAVKADGTLWQWGRDKIPVQIPSE